ncbi:MAG: hypothetical protein Q9181_004224 [Wetmoreana brouardii]
MLAGIILVIPETYHPVLLRRKAVRLRRETGDGRWRAPIESLDRSILQTVLRLLVGLVIAVGSDPLWHRNYVRLVRNRELHGGEQGGAEPEYRLPPAIAGGILVPIGLFWFGWTLFPSVHWIVPVVGSSVFGTGMLLVFSGVFTFLVDAYPLYAASALAANSFARSSFAAAFPLFGVQSKAAAMAESNMGGMKISREANAGADQALQTKPVFRPNLHPFGGHNGSTTTRTLTCPPATKGRSPGKKKNNNTDAPGSQRWRSA